MSTFDASKSLFNQYHFTVVEIDLPIVTGVTNLTESIETALPEWYWKLDEITGLVATDNMLNGNLEYESAASNSGYTIQPSNADGQGFAKNFALSETDHIAYWTFDATDMTSTIAADISGNGHNAGGVNLVGSAMKFGNGVVVNGDETPTLTVPYSTDFELPVFSIACWVESEESEEVFNIAGVWTFFSTSGLQIADSEAGTDPNAGVFATPTLIVATYDGTNIRSYVNGVLQETVASTAPVYSGTPAIEIGKYFALTGGIDDLGIYDTILNQTEITALSNATAGTIPTISGDSTRQIYDPVDTSVIVVIGDVFSAEEYSGTGTVRDLINGIDLLGDGGLVWSKASDSAISHAMYDTNRGALNQITSDSKAAETSRSNTLLTFNNNGFELGTDISLGLINNGSILYGSWTFRKSPAFFDIVTYSGNSTAGRTIAHSLGIVAGLVLVKNISSGVTSWAVQHISRGGTKSLKLDDDSAEVASSVIWNNTSSDDSNVTVGTATATNETGSNYVMYLFAHNPSAQGVIYCGEYTGDGVSTFVNLGWRPQYLLIKRVGGLGGWMLLDTSRALGAGNDSIFEADLTAASRLADRISLQSTGFTALSSDSDFNASGSVYLYMAIREA